MKELKILEQEAKELIDLLRFSSKWEIIHEEGEPWIELGFGDWGIELPNVDKVGEIPNDEETDTYLVRLYGTDGWWKFSTKEETAIFINKTL